MGRMKESPRYNVISVRITDEQLILLKRLRSQHKISVSALMREALDRLDLFPASVAAERMAEPTAG